MPQHTFIVVTGQRPSQREYELQQAIARSHAARVGHRYAVAKSPFRQDGYHTTSQRLLPRTARGQHLLPSPAAFSTERERLEEDTWPLENNFEAQLPTGRDTAWQWINGTSTDPFDVIPGSNIGAAPYALEFLIKCVAPTVASVNRCFGVANIYGRWLLEHMATSRDLFHVIVAAMKGARDSFAGLCESRDMLIHKTAAISILRTRIASSTTVVDDTTILTMLLLALLEDALGDRTAYRIHRAQVDKLTHMRSGQKGSEQFQAIVRQFETWNCPQNFMKYHQGRNKGYQLNCADQIPSNFPSGFRGLAAANHLSSKTIQAIQRIAAQPNWGVWPSSYDAKDTLTYGDPWAEATYSDFRQACPALNLPEGPCGPPLEKLICLALIRYCLNQAVYDRPRACVYHTLSIQLLESLPNTVPSSSPSERQALLWVYTMAIDCWAVWREEMTAEATYLLHQMELKFPETLSWTTTDFDCLGQQYLWTQNISKILQQHSMTAHSLSIA